MAKIYVINMIVDPEEQKSYFLTKVQAVQRKAAVSEVKYFIVVELTSEFFTGICTSEFMYSGGDVWLDFNGGQISCVEVNDCVENVAWVNSKVFLKNLKVGFNRVKISYTRPYTHDGCGLHYFKDTDNLEYIYSNFEPFHANKMIPCFDQPDIKANFQLTVRCKTSWGVISNTLVQQVEMKGDLTTHVFSQTPKISTYVFCLVAGDYHEVRLDENETGYPLGLYCRKSLAHSLEPERYFRWSIRGFKFFEEMFEIKYPFIKYDQVFVPEYNSGAMENIGCVTYKETHINPSNSNNLCSTAGTFLHEMSHMWFGNLVTLKWWDDLWLNESFATYLSYLAVDACLSDEFHQSWMLFLMRKHYSYLSDEKKTTHPISADIEDTAQTRSIFDGISYGKGAAVIKQLVYHIGFDTFKQGLREYLKENTYSNTEFKDLISVLSRRSHDLETWSALWLKTSGVNILNISIEDSVLKLVQKAEGTCESLKTHLLLYETFDSEGQTIEKEKIRLTEENFEIVLKRSPSAVLVNSEDHDYIKLIIDPLTLEFCKTSLYKIPNPLNRMLLISNLSAMVNSLHITPTDFVRLVLNNFSQETVSIILGFMLDLANANLINKIDDKNLKTEFYTMFSNKILEKKDCTDIHDRLLNFIYTDDQIKECVQWLDGGSPIEITQKHRWRLLKMYSRISVDAKALVEAEKDDSAEGLIEKLSCESSYPDAENKARIWSMFMQGCPGLSRFQRKSLMSGFMKKSQKKLLKPYTDLYFSEIPNLCKSFPYEYFLDFCSCLFPSFKPAAFLTENVEKILNEINPEYKSVINFFKNSLEVAQRNSNIKNQTKNKDKAT